MTQPEHPPLSPEGRFAWRALTGSAIAVAVVLTGIMLWYGVWVLLLLFAGILLAVLLRALAEGVHRATGLPMGGALAVVVVLLVVGFGALFYFSGTAIAEQVTQLTQALPQSVQKVRQYLDRTPIGRHIVAYVRSTNAQDMALLAQAGTLVTGAFGVAVYTLIVIALGIYLAVDPALYINGTVGLLPRSVRHRAREVLHQVGFTLRWWIIAQIVDMTVVGVLTWIGLWMMGVPLALILGVLAALFNFVPNFGPLVSYVPAVLLALTVDPAKVVYVTIFYVVLQNVEGYVLMPLLQRKAVDLPPALTILMQVLLTILAGGMGLMLSAPLTAAFVVAVKMLYVHDVRGEAVELPEGDEGPKPDAPGASGAPRALAGAERRGAEE
jgi:predicted PurR-regulated permease PerM